MKLKTIIDAKEAVTRLAEKRYTDYKKLREIVGFRKAVETEFDFYCEQEKRAVDTYAEKNADGTPAFLADGRLKLKDVPAKEAFEAEISKLRDTDIEDFKPLKLKGTDFRSSDDLPTPNDMIALEGIVVFED